MGTLFKNVNVVDSKSEFDQKQVNLLVENGTITKISGNNIDENNHNVCQIDDLHISPGWVDFRANLGFPGNEHKEDPTSASLAALAGGFTKVVNYFSVDRPCNDSSALSFSRGVRVPYPVDILNVASITKELDGKVLTDMFELKAQGAVAFTDLEYTSKNTHAFKTALEYVKNFQGLIVNFPFAEDTFPNGIVHEGSVSTSLGLKGSPSIGEVMDIERSLKLLEYTDSRLHIAGVSSAEGAEHISKNSNKKLTADVSFYNLILTDDVLVEFDSLFKVKPFIRTEKDRKALVNAIKKGSIQVICSDHQPQNIELKECEFEQAAFGMSSLEFMFPALNEKLVPNELTLSELISTFTHGPRAILDLAPTIIAEGYSAEFTLFKPNEIVSIDENAMKSKSRNSPFIGQKLKGKVIGTYKDNDLFLVSTFS
ncbi:MAG: dihydroorotase [Flavobacteriales bacterium]|nr:dihydroorotase [Flavobacteriales bacterium]